MERLTNKQEADSQRRNYEKRLEQGYPRNVPEERFLRLAAYEDLDEQGRLVVLPCKVGSTVWFISWCDEPHDGVYCPYDCNSSQRQTAFRKDCLKYCGVYSTQFQLRHIDQVGKTMFLTRKEAEIALNQMARQTTNTEEQE